MINVERDAAMMMVINDNNEDVKCDVINYGDDEQTTTKPFFACI